MAANFAKIQGLVSLVTGGASGFGRATVERFVKHGSRVIVCDLPTSEGQEVANTLGADNCVFVPTDVTSTEDVLNALSVAKSKYDRLDAVVNCVDIGAAYKTYNFNKEIPHSFDDFKRVLSVNAAGTFNVIRLAVGLIGKNKPDHDGQRGIVINTASAAAFDGEIGQAAYSASKAAIAGMTLPIARDLSSKGIRCVTIATGMFDTPLVAGLPERIQEFLVTTCPFPSRLGYPAEYAQLAQSIIENPMINGEVIRIDGAFRG